MYATTTHEAPLLLSLHVPRKRNWYYCIVAARARRAPRLLRGDRRAAVVVGASPNPGRPARSPVPTASSQIKCGNGSGGSGGQTPALVLRAALTDTRLRGWTQTDRAAGQLARGGRAQRDIPPVTVPDLAGELAPMASWLRWGIAVSTRVIWLGELCAATKRLTDEPRPKKKGRARGPSLLR